MQKAKFIIFIVVFVLLMVGSMAVSAGETKGDGDDLDIILWDIIDGATEGSRSDGDGDDLDIILWDIIDGVTDGSRNGG